MILANLLCFIYIEDQENFCPITLRKFFVHAELTLGNLYLTEVTAQLNSTLVTIRKSSCTNKINA